MTETPVSNFTSNFTRQILFRHVDDGDGRTLEARIVPYNVIATVSDGGPAYQEMFMPGAFRSQTRAANRIEVTAGDARGILLNYEHGQSIGDVIGRGQWLDDRPDALYAAFRIVDHSDGDKALELIRSGDLRGMSVEFSVRRSRTTPEGVVQRLDARVRGVALCRDLNTIYGGPKAAYSGAEVIALRQQDETHEDDQNDEAEAAVEVPSLLPPSFDRLAKFGVEKPRWIVRKEKLDS